MAVIKTTNRTAVKAQNSGIRLGAVANGKPVGIFNASNSFSVNNKNIELLLLALNSEDRDDRFSLNIKSTKTGRSQLEVFSVRKNAIIGWWVTDMKAFGNVVFSNYATINDSDLEDI
jgi:hypothetical protein